MNNNNLDLIINDLSTAKKTVESAYSKLKRSYTGTQAQKEYLKCEKIINSLNSIISLLKS